jgi:hypothetical protein
MDKNEPKDAIVKEVISANEAAAASKPLTELEEIVIYDECGDTMWDRVLRQEESKIKTDHTPET